MPIQTNPGRNNPTQPIERDFPMTNPMTTSITRNAGIAIAAICTLPTLAGSPVDPCAPVNLAAIPAQGFTRHVELVGDRLYVLDGEVLDQGYVANGQVAELGSTGLRIFDVADPANPVLIGAMPTPGRPSDIAIAGDLAFIADGGTGGLLVVDLADPETPSIVGLAETRGLASSVALLPASNGADVRVAVADGADGVIIYGIFGNDPDQALTIDTDGLATDVVSWGTTLAVADGWNGVLLYDMADPNNPIEIARFPVANSAVSLTHDAANGLLYAAQAMGGIAVFDVSSPLAPVEITEYDTPGTARGLAVAGTDLYVADTYGGLHTLDASVPPFIGIVETQDVEGAPLSIALRELDAGPIAFVAANQGGVRILNLQECDAFCPADFAPPFGILDLADISLFIADFERPVGLPPYQDNRAEALAPPFEIADLADITVFVTSFVAGCP
jgi:hypothetical protein